MVRRTIREWNKLIEGYYTSGLSQTEWCEKEDINLHTFRDRLSKMRKSAETGIKSREEKDISNNNQIGKGSAKCTIYW